MIESILFNSEKYRKYGYTSITKTLNNPDPDTSFKLVDNIDSLDMNRYTVVTFSNGDSYRAKNYIIYKHMNEPSASFNPTAQNNYLTIRRETTSSGLGPGIEVNYHGDYGGSDIGIKVDWIKIEINVD